MCGPNQRVFLLGWSFLNEEFPKPLPEFWHLAEVGNQGSLLDPLTLSKVPHSCQMLLPRARGCGGGGHGVGVGGIYGATGFPSALLFSAPTCTSAF